MRSLIKLYLKELFLCPCNLNFQHNIFEFQQPSVVHIYSSNRDILAMRLGFQDIIYTKILPIVVLVEMVKDG